MGRHFNQLESYVFQFPKNEIVLINLKIIA